MDVPVFDPQLTPSQKQELIARYRNLLSLCRPYLKHGDTALLRQAFNLAFWAGRDQKTHLGGPGIYYSLDLTEILVTEAGLGTASMIAAMIRKAFLEKKIKQEDIASAFGNQVLSILTGLKRIESINTGKTAIFSENFIRLLLTLSNDVRAILLKTADTLYHMRILGRLPQNLQESFARDAYYIYAPIAHRLGLYHIKTELEDLSMKFLHPVDYRLISNKLKETDRSRQDYILNFTRPIERELEKTGFRFEIKSRTKSVHSIWTKMVNQKVPFEEVFDLLAIRIIIDSTAEREKEDCWRVYSIVTDLYNPNTERLRDWISVPKASGYESLHTTVLGPQQKWVEVQIRTSRMDEIAEKGHAAHWKYKETKAASDTAGWLNSLRDLLEHSDRQYLDQIPGYDVTSSDIFVFTPTGDLRKLPAGSTVLDFAFDIHTNLGFQCNGARVNGKIFPIKHVLQNGDEVEILSARNQKPKSDWLSFLKTSRARSKVKRALKDEELKEAELGKEMLMRKFRNWKVSFTDENINKVIKTLKYKTPLDLYQAIALEKQDTASVKELFFPPVVRTEPSAPAGDPEIKGQDARVHHKADDLLLLDQNMAGINYTLASCCHPIFGDDVFGFVTISKGITVHRKTCPNAEELMKKYDYRIMDVQWRSAASTGSFQTTIRISGIDQLGLLNTLSEVISNEMKVNIRSITIDSNNGIFEGLIKLFVNDTAHLDMLLHRIARIKGVLKATRLD